MAGKTILVCCTLLLFFVSRSSAASDANYCYQLRKGLGLLQNMLTNTYNNYKALEGSIYANGLFNSVLVPMSVMNLPATNLLEAPPVNAVFNTSTNSNISDVNIHHMYGSVMKDVQDNTCEWLTSLPDPAFPNADLLSLFPLNCSSKLDLLKTAAFYSMAQPAYSMTQFMSTLPDCGSGKTFSKTEFITTYLEDYYCELDEIYSVSGQRLFDMCSPNSVFGYNCSSCN